MADSLFALLNLAQEHGADRDYFEKELSVAFTAVSG
jgi:hypothetical protein